MNRVWSLPALAAAAILVLAACSSAPSTSGSPSGAIDTGAAPTSPIETIAPILPAQTDTSWGRIWDDVPDSFPEPVGAEPATDAGTGPLSSQLVVTAAASDVADSYVTGLHTSGWTVNKDGPLEDGSVVVNATSTGGCKAQITVHPIEDASLVAILFGASCPFK